jgi:hypothetical protein
MVKIVADISKTEVDKSLSVFNVCLFKPKCVQVFFKFNEKLHILTLETLSL